MTVPVLLVALQALVLTAYGVLVLAGRTRVRATGDRIVTGLTVVWRAIDVVVIDGTVNALALVIRGWGTMLRRAESGPVRVYTLATCAGVVAMIGYYLWR